MSEDEDQGIIKEFNNFIGDENYPCVAAKAAMSNNNIECIVVDHIGCPKDDPAILSFLYKFIHKFRESSSQFHSAAVIFKSPGNTSDEIFDHLLWQRLQSLSDLDAKNFEYDQRVDADPLSPAFSFSLAEEAFFVIGLNPGSKRRSRHFKHPVLIFNPHIQFEEMRLKNRYDKMKNIVRRRDKSFSGSINPMLDDFGKTSEAQQYSGRKYDRQWICPLKVHHAKTHHHSTEK